VLDLAEEEAQRLGHARIGSEDLLLGILGFGYRNAQILTALGVELEAARAAVERIAGTAAAAAAPPEALPLSARAERVIRHALDICARMRSGYFGGDELLLGVLAEPDCTAAAALRALGLSLDEMRLVIEVAHLEARVLAYGGPEPQA
jgi:ATP-dependent Clp protease ATP-binding subunit ClpA